jgi:hypothetical protein
LAKRKDIKNILKLLHDNQLLFGVTSTSVDYISDQLDLDLIYLTDLLHVMEKQKLIFINKQKIPFEIELITY